MKKLLLAAIIATFSVTSYAQLLKITLDCSGTALSTAQCDSLESKFQTEINKEDVPELPVGEFADQMANAVSISTAGTGSDYSNLFDIFVVGFHPIALGADVDLSDIDNVDSAGIALSPTLVAGVNLDVLPIDKIGSVELKDFDLFFSYFSQKDDKLYDQDNTTVGGEITNFSTHIRYKWLADVSALGGLFKWNGVQIHTGYRYAKNKLDIAYNIGKVDPTPIDAGAPVGTVNLGLTGAKSTASIESSSHTIPLEISTSGRALYFLTMYTGLGMDYNLTAKSEISVNAEGTVDTDNAGITGTVVADQSADGEGEATNFRAFGGIQFDLWKLKINTGVQKSLSNDTLALNVGTRFAW